MTNEERQSIIDGEHLQVLSLCYFIYAGINALFSLFGLFYMLMSLLVGSEAFRVAAHADQGAPPAFVAPFVGLFGLGVFVLLVGLAVLKFEAARRLRQRRSRGFCMFVAALSCIAIPFGTALGIAALRVLTRESVRRLFDTEAPAAASVVPAGAGA
jgi:hypothetical protein